MNEFLDNLAQRTMNSEQGVEPRLPSLFAPAAPAAIWPPLTVATESEPFEVAVDRETDVAAPMEILRPTQLSRFEEVDRETGAAMKSLRPSQLSRLEEEEQPKGSPSPALIRHQTLPSVLQNAQPDSPSSIVNNRVRGGSRVEDQVRQGMLSPATATTAPKPLLLADRRDVRVEDRVVRQDVNGTAIHSAMTKTSEGREIEVRLAQAPSMIAPPAQDQPRRETKISRIKANASEAATRENQGSFIVRPRLDQFSELPAPRLKTEDQSATTTEQVINVTIGRVEVRATPAPAAAMRSSNQKPPVMSLDDYLRRRSGGGGGGSV